MNSRAADGLLHMPQLEERSALPYVSIRRTVAMDGLAAAIDRDFPALFGWLADGSAD